MYRLGFAILLTAVAAGAAADTVVPTRTIRAREVIGPGDLQLSDANIAGSFSRVADVEGLEARIALYPGRPIRQADVGPPAIVERNQVVDLIFSRNGLVIRTEARALERAATGERVKVMNMASRATVFGKVLADGSISVSE